MYTKQERKKWMEYKKMAKRHRKTLIWKAKHSEDWDSQWIDEYIRIYLENMKEYYEMGINVSQVDEDVEKVISSINKAIVLYDKFLWYANGDNLPDARLDLEAMDNKKCCKPIWIYEDGVTEEKYCELLNEGIEKEKELFQEFFTYLGKEMRNWKD